eukprot:4549074-Prorocentrum_lima.AAC.1
MLHLSRRGLLQSLACMYEEQTPHSFSQKCSVLCMSSHVPGKSSRAHKVFEECDHPRVLVGGPPSQSP